MKFKRSFLIILLFIAVIFISPYSWNYVKAIPQLIHQSSNSLMITSGVTLEKISRFTEEGWLNINVVRADLSNDYIKVDTLVDKSSIRNLSTTLNLARNSNAIAAINGSFFNWSDQPGLISPIGPLVQSGIIQTASEEMNKALVSMGTLSFDNLNKVLIDYWKADIYLVTQNGTKIKAGRYNQSYYGYQDLTILDRKFSQQSIGAGQFNDPVTEMVVENGIVTDIRFTQPSVLIPLNGYVIVTKGQGAKLITDNFSIGDPVVFDIITQPDWANMSMAVSGGSILVKNGQIPASFSHQSDGRHPRTAAGSSEDGRQLMLVTVDGRQQSSIGLSQQEMAELMMEFGAYNALNLDGGGSTTLVARTPGNHEPELINSPSDGIERRVANAIGLLSFAPASPLDGLIITSDDENVFVNTSRELYVNGYDRYFNPVTIDPSQIQWSVKGISGTFEGSTFYPSTVGIGIITASLGNISSQYTISSLSAPVKLEPNPKSIQLTIGESQLLSVTGVNKNGYTAEIYPEDLNWSVNGEIGTVTNGIFKASAMGTGFIDIWLGTTHVFCPVSVPSYTKKIIDNFESIKGYFLGYPSSVTGSLSLYDKKSVSGKYSAELLYNFIKDPDETRAAYVMYPDKGVPLEPNTVKLGLWVYNTNPSSTCWLRAEIFDTKGNKHRVDFTTNMNWTGWKYLEASLLNLKVIPASISSIYAVQVMRIVDIGNIYFDDLSATTYGYLDVDLDSIPADTPVEDPYEKDFDYVPNEDSFRFSVSDISKKPVNILDKLIIFRMADKINKYIDVSMSLGSNTEELTPFIQKTQLSTVSNYNYRDVKTSRFISLDSSGKSLRIGHTGQWTWFLDKLNSFKGENIFIILNDSPDDFQDNMEGALLQDILTEYRQRTVKNVWVFFKGQKNESKMIRGIKYFEVSGPGDYDITPESLDLARYLLVTVKGRDIYYLYKTIV